MSLGSKKIVSGYTDMNKAKLIKGGKPYFDCLLHMIESAIDSIHLQTYIYEDDETGRRVAAALQAAVKRNVRIYLLADGYASKGMSRLFINTLISSGINFRFFNPLYKSRYFYFGRRMHHKVVTVDARYALVGGVNITDRYNDMPGKPAWLDFAVYIEGEAAKQLCVLCWKTWNNFQLHMTITPCEQKEIDFRFNPTEACVIGMRRNDWVRRKNEISATYVDMFRHSVSHITILCSYFLPGRMIRRQMIYAAKRGVRIRVVTTGASDVIISKYAERFMYDWLLRNNIELYEYQPTILHGKIAVCDSEWVTIGSYNINNISAYASIELNMNVKNAAFAKETEHTLQQIIDKDCVRIIRKRQKFTRNPLTQFTYWLSHQLIRLGLYVFTFYFKHKN